MTGIRAMSVSKRFRTRHGETLALDAFEVEEAFEVPLAFLMDPRNHERRGIEAYSPAPGPQRISSGWYCMTSCRKLVF